MEVAKYRRYSVRDVGCGWRMGYDSDVHKPDRGWKPLCRHIGHNTVEAAVCCRVAVGNLRSEIRESIPRCLLVDYAKRNDA